ncbi:hypothetical protein R3P38DRAFT_3343241 [Favolaschia claudopus]|uniref:F-box domain-containing protein n=1 Tax=Favolaschia claudopus TaxID=2862362 RepID=A0AAW0DM29_9AGAR
MNGSGSACHRALGIQEIVRLICYDLPKKNLALLARTSKTFTESALDLLWWEQWTLAALVKCMPEDVWEQRGTRSTGIVVHMQHLLRPITSTDLPRLLYYSVRIRQLELVYVSQSVHHELLSALDMALPAQNFMPKLVQFVWAPNKKDGLSILRHFLGPRIRKLHLSLPTTAGLSVLPFVKTSCSRVSDFDLALPSNSRNFIPLISDAVCAWGSLTELSVPNLDKAGFIHAAQLPSLKKLGLCSVDEASPLHLPEFLTKPAFPALEDLSVCCKTARFCVGLVQIISSHQLSTLSISPMSPWTTDAWQTLHSALRDHLNHVALTSLDITDCGSLVRPAEDALAPYLLSSDVLRPLLVFRKMKSVTIQTFPGIDVDDAFMEELAKAWKRLSSLHLCSEVSIMQCPRATLQCLIPFARHCPRLGSLGIRIDARDVPTFKQVAGDRVEQNWLDCIYVGTSWINSSIENMGEAAAFITNLFLMLDLSLWAYDNPMPEPFSSYQETWGRVSDLLPIFRSVRSDEQEFWTEELQAEDDEEEDEEDQEEASTTDGQTNGLVL